MMSFMISGGENCYLYFNEQTHSYTPVSEIGRGAKWEQRVKAENVLKNAVNKNLRNRYSVIEVEDLVEETLSEDVPVIDDPTIDTEVCSNHFDSNCFLPPKEEAAKLIAEEEIEDQVDLWLNKISDIQRCIEDAGNRKNELASKLVIIEREICDINHYIEFTKLNAYQGWLAFNMLQSKLRNRRKIKNELEVVSKISECEIDTSALADVSRAIEQIKMKRYTPRILNTLFE